MGCLPALCLQRLHVPPGGCPVLPVLGRALPQPGRARPVDEQQVQGVQLQPPEDALKGGLRLARACLQPASLRRWQRLRSGVDVVRMATSPAAGPGCLIAP